MKGIFEPKGALVGSLQAQVTCPARTSRVVRGGQGGAPGRARTWRRELGFEEGCTAFVGPELEVRSHAFKLVSKHAFAASVHVQLAKWNAWTKPTKDGGRRVTLPIDHSTIVEVSQVLVQVLEVVGPRRMTRQFATQDLEANAPGGVAGPLFAPRGQFVSVGFRELPSRSQPKDISCGRNGRRCGFFAKMS